MPTLAGQVGLNCSCGENLRHAYVAKSHPMPGGQRRLRYCPSCHAGVESVERVVGTYSRLLIIDLGSIAPSAQRLIRALLRELQIPFGERTDA